MSTIYLDNDKQQSASMQYDQLACRAMLFAASPVSSACQIRQAAHLHRHPVPDDIVTVEHCHQCIIFILLTA